MEAGIIKLAPAFAGSNETTAGEMKEYMQAVAARFCEVTGLVLIETVDHERGAFFIIGEEGKTHGLVAIGNSNYGSYHYRVIGVSGVGPDHDIRLGMNIQSNTNSYNGQGYTIASQDIWMKYIKTDHGIVIGLQSDTVPLAKTPTMIMQKIRIGDTEELAMLRIYSNSFYASYTPMLSNEEKSTVLFTQSGYNRNIIPTEKEAMAEICLESRAELPGMRLYTNKKMAAVWNKARIGGIQYIVASYGTANSATFALLMQASDTAPQA